MTDTLIGETPGRFQTGSLRSMSCMSARPQGASDSGFVLPYVLAVVAILALLTTVGAQVLARSQDSISDMAGRDALAWALDEAEAETTHVFLTRPIVSRGLDMSNRPVDDSELMIGEPTSEEGLTDDDVWMATGGVRRTQIGNTIVDIAYQDADGLVSLNAADLPVLAAWLQPVIGSREEARILSARISDYIDENTDRQFLGAERAEYRLARLAPPSNSSLRSFQEIGQIYGFAKKYDLPPEAFIYTTLFPTAGLPRTGGIPPGLFPALAAFIGKMDGYSDDMVETQLIDSRFPSDRAQFVLTATSPNARFGLRRVIEIERTAGAADQPFTRRCVAEYPVPAGTGDQAENHASLQYSFSAAVDPRP
ncbi:hypothetical protein [Hyphomonas chukchiensis]|uniref:hypothetical protein n=1 Tax=Hyphomonas chukchiensis TaxID=1280947 RepID=UPI0030F743DF